MKKLLAILLALLLALSAAGAEEAFQTGADALLNSIDLQRDMLTLTVDAEGQTYRCRLAQADGTVLFKIDEGGTTAFEAQIMEDQLYASLAGTVINLKYEDLQSMFTSATDSLDMQVVAEMLQLLLMKAIMPHVTYENSDGVHIVYAATGKELYADMAAFIDEVLADEKYYPTIDQLLSMLGGAAKTQLPSAAQLAQMWPESKENLLAQEPDFHVRFELTADARFTAADITGEIGSEEDLYLMEWAWRDSGDTKSLTGKLTERITRSETSRDYDINISVEFHGNLWSLKIDYPSQSFTLEGEGSFTEESARFFLSILSLRQRFRFQVWGNCSQTDDGLSAQLTITDSRYNVYTASALLGEHSLDVSVMNYQGSRLFSLRALEKDDQTVWASLEINDNNSPVSAVYDGEKITMRLGDYDYLITWTYPSDHELVATVHPVNNPEVTEDATVRAAYEGEEGHFTFTFTLTDVKGSEALSAQLVCEPTEGIGAPLSEREGIIYLTPEVMQSLMQQMMQ